MSAFKHKNTGEVVIPSADSDYEKRLTASSEWSELTTQELEDNAEARRIEAQRQADAESAAAERERAATSGESKEATAESASPKSSGKQKGS